MFQISKEQNINIDYQLLSIFHYENVLRMEILDQTESNSLWDTIFEMLFNSEL